ncbi:MAG: hypothetical protein PF482_02535 [Desulfobacteraceae bacterium]|nr:hypothetical protein [Desulfobacteraceae bacterium]
MPVKMLKKNRQELEVAMTNANLAREVVFELFQDLGHGGGRPYEECCRRAGHRARQSN